jgi:Leucine-rich repeat (LRR) protein
MRVVCRCEHCAKKLRATEEMIGKRVRCPECGQATRLLSPGTDTLSAVPVEEEPAPERRPAPEPRHAADRHGPDKAAPPKTGTRKDAPAPPPELEDVEELPEDDRPRRGRPDKKAAGPRPNGQVLLRVSVMVIGLLGAGFAAMLGYIWSDEQEKTTPQMLALAKELGPMMGRPDLVAIHAARGNAILFLYIGAGIGLLGAVLGLARLGIVGGILMIGSVVAAGVTHWPSLIFTCLLPVGGVLALFIVSGGAARRAAEKRAEQGKAPPSNTVGYVLGVCGLVLVLAASLFLGFVLVKGHEENQKAYAQLKGGPGPWGGKEKDPDWDNPFRDLGKFRDFGKDLGKGEKDPPVPTPGYDTVKAEVEKAAKGAKLAKLDLGPAGMDLVMDAPEDAVLKKEDFGGGITVTAGERFSLMVRVGQEGRPDRDSLRFYNIVVNAPDLFVTSGQRFDPDSGHTLAAQKTLGYQDIAVTSNDRAGDKRLKFNRADALLMVWCARSLALKDPAAPVTLEKFRSKDRRFGKDGEPEKEDPAKVIRLDRQATNATLALVEKNGEVRVLDLSRTLVTDEGLSRLAGLKQLEDLNLSGRSVKDAGLAHLAGLTALKRLDLNGHAITDEGLKHLGKLVNLEWLDLQSWGAMKGSGFRHLANLKKLKTLRVSGGLDDSAFAGLKGLDALESLEFSGRELLGTGLANLKALPNLKRLKLASSGINDAGMSGFKSLAGLEELDLSGAKITGPGLANLKGMAKLKSLNLASNKVTDAGAKHLAALTALEHLQLDGSEITDAGLLLLAKLPKLRRLDLSQCKGVTEKGMAAAFDDHEALAELSVWGSKAEGYNLPQRMKPPTPLDKLKPADHAALIARRRATTKVDEKAEGKPIVGITLENSDTDDLDLADLRGLKTLRSLSLGRYSKVTDTGLFYLQGLTGLEELDLEGATIHGAGLRYLAPLKKLKKLRLPNDVRDAGERTMEVLAGLPELESLSISQYSTKLKGPAVAKLAALKKLKELGVGGEAIDDAALASFKALPTLETLRLLNTKVLGSGLPKLKDLPNLKRLTIVSNEINDAGLESLKDLTNLEELDVNPRRYSEGKITGEVFAKLKGLTKLKAIRLAHHKVNDTGAAAIAAFADLEDLDLEGAAITDTGLGSLKALKKLRKLDLTGCKNITAKGVAQLDEQEELAEVILNNTPASEYRRPKKVRPPVAFDKLKPADHTGLIERHKGRSVVDEKADGKPIVSVVFNNAKLTDLDLADLRELKSLKTLNIGFGGTVTDAGLHYLKDLTNLEELNLYGARIEGDGLFLLAGLTKLKKLYLPYGRYTTRHLAPLAALVNLEEIPLDLSTDTVDKLKLLSGMKIRQLHLPYGKLAEGSLGHVAKMTSLEVLTVPGSPEWRIDAAGMANLKGLTKLKQLTLRGSAGGEGYAHLAGMTDLEVLDLGDSAITDAGLKHLAGMTKLRSLGLVKTKVTDDGLSSLAKMAELQHLGLGQTGVKGAGFEKVKGLAKLSGLDLTGTPFGDDGMKHLSALTALNSLQLAGTAVTDAGLEQLKGMEKLGMLNLSKTKVTGTGFAKAGPFPNLSLLIMTDSQLGDAGIEHLAGLKQLDELYAQNTPLTGKGFAKLKGLMELRDIDVTGSKLDDAGLKELGELTKLDRLVLNKTAITDAGLPALKGLADLQGLMLADTAVTGSGLKDVKLAKVTYIDLSRTKLADTHMENLGNFPAVTALQVDGTGIGDAGLAHLKKLEKLQSIRANKTAITDTGLDHLAGVKALQFLGADGTKVTRAGVEKLRKALPKVSVSYDDE